MDAFEQHLRDLALENWAGMTAALARAGIDADPIAEDIETGVARARTAFSEQASAILAAADRSVANADISTLAGWLARRFVTEINERRQRQLGVTHFIWRTQDDGQVRAAHASVMTGCSPGRMSFRTARPAMATTAAVSRNLRLSTGRFC